MFSIGVHSAFEGTVWVKIGWFLQQQILKLYADKTLGMDGFVLVESDSDVMWFRDVCVMCDHVHAPQHARQVLF